MSDNSRIAKNSILLSIRLLLYIVISIYTSRIILENLGIVDFGLYNVAGSAVMAFMFLNSAMTSSTQRFLTIAIAKKDKGQINQVFNVSIVIHILLGFGIIAVSELFGYWFINHKMVIPEGRETAVMITFQLSLVAAFVSIISIPYKSLIIAKERMGAFAYISLVDITIKLLIALSISIVPYDRLIFYSLFIATSNVFIRFIYNIYCKAHFPESTFKFYKIGPLYKEMAAFASWGVFGKFAVVINQSIQDMLLNVFFSPVVNAARGIALRVAAMADDFNGNFQLAVTPQITKACAIDDKKRFFSLIYNSSRFSMYLEWMLVLPLLLSVDEVLDMWLVEVPDFSSVFLTLVLINTMVCSIKDPLIFGLRANGNIKYPEIVGGLLLIANFPLSYVALNTGQGPESVFLIMIVCNVLVHLSRIYFAMRYLEMSVIRYMQSVLVIPLMVICISSIAPILTKRLLIINNDLLYIIIIAVISILSIFFSVYIIDLSDNEKEYLKKVIRKRVVSKWTDLRKK